MVILNFDCFWHASNLILEEAAYNFNFSQEQNIAASLIEKKYCSVKNTSGSGSGDSKNCIGSKSLRPVMALIVMTNNFLKDF